MAPSTQQQALREEFEVEDDAIMRWRIEQFHALGFDEVASALLGACRVDLNQARSLIRHGCPLPLAFQILL